MLSDSCIIKYDPVSSGNKTASDPWWLIAFLEENNELRDYYSWFIYRRTGIKLMKPAWGPHISIIRGEEPIYKELWRKYEGKEVAFKFDEFIKTNGNHWWLKVACEDFLDIREELGISRKHAIGLHLTIGAPSPTQQELSEYFTFLLHNENKI